MKENGNNTRILALEHLIDCINSNSTVDRHYRLETDFTREKPYNLQILHRTNGEYSYCGNGKYFDTAEQAEKYINDLEEVVIYEQTRRN